jgi:hypothetical protein
VSLLKLSLRNVTLFHAPEALKMDNHVEDVSKRNQPNVMVVPAKRSKPAKKHEPGEGGEEGDDLTISEIPSIHIRLIGVQNVFIVHNPPSPSLKNKNKNKFCRYQIQNLLCFIFFFSFTV